MKEKIIYLFACALLIAAVVAGCKKEKPDPANPFESLNDAPTDISDTVDANTFLGIHKNILSVKCANPSCHDGSFEPDYRTVESAYNTLVYHPVIKKLSPWNFRVVPFDTAKSWLWQRVNHEKIISGMDTSGGRMPLYKDALSSSELKNISTWILNGARDIHGAVPVFPNEEPKVNGYVAVDSANTNVTLSSAYDRADSLYYNPFIVSHNQAMIIAVEAEDDSTDASLFQNCTLKLSQSQDNFTSAVSKTCTLITFTDATGLHKLWIAYINTKNFPASTTQYMRFYLNDGDHPASTEFPLNESLIYYKTFWSFYIKP